MWIEAQEIVLILLNLIDTLIHPHETEESQRLRPEL